MSWFARRIGWRTVNMAVLFVSVAIAVGLLFLGRYLAGALLALALALLLNVFTGRAPFRDGEAGKRDAAEVGRLTQALDAAESRLDTLRDLTDLLVRPLDYDSILQAVVVDVGSLVHAGGAAVFLVDDERGELRLADLWRFRQPLKRLAIPLEAASPIVNAFRVGQATLLDRSDPQVDTTLRALGEKRSGDPLAVPLTAGGETFGVILAGGTRRPFTAAELEIAQTVAAEAAVALSNARLLAKERVARRHAEGLRLVAEMLVSPHDLANRLGTATEAARELLEAERVDVAFGYRRLFGLPEPADPELEERLLSRWAAEAKPTTESLVLGPEEDGRLRYLFPVRREERIVAVVAVQTVSALSERGRVLASAVAKQVALALDNAYLLRAATARAADLETIFVISEVIGSSLDPKVVLARVLDVVLKIISADAATLMTWDGPRRRLAGVMSRGVRSRAMVHVEVGPGEDVPGSVFEERRSLRIGRLEEYESPLAEAARAEGFRSWLAVPLLARGRSLGVLSVLSKDRDAFMQKDEELVGTFATQAALAIDNATLYGREHHVATVMQASAQPAKIPEVPGLEIETMYRPAGVESEIGGDFYDVFRACDGRVVLVIADVCGKGVQAATKTTRVKYLLRGLVAAGSGPVEAVTELNRAICEEGKTGDIVTAWVGFLDVEAGMLEHVSAGHPPGLVSAPGSCAVERLDPTGPLLGAHPEVEYDVCRTHLEPGTTLLLYTDGVTEARRGEEFFGESRLRELLLGETSAAGVRGRLDRYLDEFAGVSLRDDAAALAVTLTGRFSLEDRASAV